MEEEYLHTLEKNLDALEMQVETLSGTIVELSKKVSKEKERGLQTLPEVEKWISLAEVIEMKASSLLNESISECYNLSTYGDCSQISEKNYHYSGRVCLTLKEVEAQCLRSKGVFEELDARAPFSSVQKMLPLQPIVSREKLLEKVWKCLSENEWGTLGLYGVAGVGKTFLLSQIKNKFREDREERYGCRIFVNVNSDGVEGIRNTIREWLGIDREYSEESQKAATYKLLNKRRYVLYLDGVQREGVDLEEIGVPRPSRENGCKIVFTTRSREACKRKWVDAEVEVKCLSPEEAWEVFQEVVGETTLKSHPDIPNLARIVARRCGGLPIALSLIGKTMSRKRTVREWYHAIQVLVSSTTEFSSSEVPILKFAYDNLPGENTKSCFLYCALFSKHLDISKRDLVDCWIAEGMIKYEDRETAEIKGYEMIGDLVTAGLLMENESGHSVKMMHDTVLEMAFGIASQASDSGRRGQKIVVKCGAKIHQMPKFSDGNMVRRMSVTSTQIETISDAPPCSELTTLFLRENVRLQRISGDFFRWMTSLAVLDLSRNFKFYALTNEVSSLVSLQLLNLSSTRIARLPSGVKNLRKLIHLNLERTLALQEINVISSLLNLQVLRLFGSGVLVDVGLVEDIDLLKNLQELSLNVENVSVLQRIQSNHRLATLRLNLRNIRTTEGELFLRQSSLRQLVIYRCTIFSERSWETVHSGNIQKLPQFRNIREVYLHECDGLEDLTWLIVAPSLDHLSLCDCKQMKQVISREKATAQLGQTSQQPFQNLIWLHLYDLPELESIYWTPLPFPVLRDVSITSCPKLRRLPLNVESAKGNRVNVDFDETCIQGVKWEDEATKQRFSDLVLNTRDREDEDFLW